MNVRPSCLLLACAVLLSASSPAPAQPAGNRKKALELWDKAKVQYDLGHWSQAIDLWEKAYETYSAPEFLFNIGQAHRQDGNCERALFFYRRYLDARPNARNRPEVERVMKDLQETCKAASTPAKPGSGKPGEPGVPGQTGPGKTAPAGRTAPVGRPAAGPRPAVTGPAVKGPAGSRPDVADAGGDGNDSDDGVEEEEGDGDGEIAGGVEATAERPSLFTVRVAAGPSFPSFGGALDVGTLTSFDLSAGHPFYVGSVVLEPGVLAAYTPVPWDGFIKRTNEANVVVEIPTSGTAGLISLLANVGVSREVASRFSVRGELGLGGVFFSGLTKEGNPFIDEGDEASGIIPLFGARVALGAEYALTPNLILHAEPVVFSYSPTSPLKRDIEQITRFEILLGAGYRM